MIIDDEAEARAGIKLLLARDEEIRIVGSCSNGLEAIEAITAHQPQLLLLDIQMPEINGFEVLGSLPPTNMPAVIFITAYDQYALRAFDIHAIDYLLKPFTDQRFFEAIRHAKNHIQSASAAQIHQNLRALLAHYQQKLPREELPRLVHESQQQPERMVIKSEGSIIFLPIADIQWIEAHDYYIKIHLEHQSYLLRESMKRILQRLPAQKFCRIHKSSIVNLNFVQELQPVFNGEYAVVMQNGEKLKLSRGYRKAFFEKIRPL
ncbi:MAG: DNA-binding response regulator [Bacteroidetes bacterium]|nr:MAG: DNA-binding response regulator [Bacteroidota bacterium]